MHSEPGGKHPSRLSNLLYSSHTSRTLSHTTADGPGAESTITYTLSSLATIYNSEYKSVKRNRKQPAVPCKSPAFLQHWRQPLDTSWTSTLIPLLASSVRSLRISCETSLSSIFPFQPLAIVMPACPSLAFPSAASETIKDPTPEHLCPPTLTTNRVLISPTTGLSRPRPPRSKQRLLWPPHWLVPPLSNNKNRGNSEIDPRLFSRQLALPQPTHATSTAMLHSRTLSMSKRTSRLPSQHPHPFRPTTVSPSLRHTTSLSLIVMSATFRHHSHPLPSVLALRRRSARGPGPR